jgi:hypothetical protein
VLDRKTSLGYIPHQSKVGKEEQSLSMHQSRWSIVAAIACLVAVAFPISPVYAAPLVQKSNPNLSSALSPYWGSAITQWESIILEEADRRGLDPDLIAAVIWKESLGRSYARGPAGAVGLMMVMPKEAGFTWRPTIAELQDPWINVFWGARALSIIIRQAHGDLYNALSAYNGGWDQIHLSGPRRYAREVLEYYAKAVAMRYGVSPEAHWIATVAAIEAPRVVTVNGPRRELARYTQRPVMADMPDVTTEGPPTSVAFHPREAGYTHCRVGIWIVVDDQVLGAARPVAPRLIDPFLPPPGMIEAWHSPTFPAGQLTLGTATPIRLIELDSFRGGMNGVAG